MTCRRARRPRRRDVRVYHDASSCYWVVEQGGHTFSRHRRQSRAIEVGIRAARRRRADLITHGRDGRIRSKDSYGNESPWRDREH